MAIDPTEPPQDSYEQTDPYVQSCDFFNATAASERGSPRSVSVLKEGRLWSAAIVGVAVLALDQISKAGFADWPCEDVICPLRNDELMLGVAGGTTLQVTVASVAALAMFWLWIGIASRYAVIPAVASALVIAGVVGNLLDRILIGSVRDFLAFPRNTVVNVADLALAAGLLIAVAAFLWGFISRPSTRSA